MARTWHHRSSLTATNGEGTRIALQSMVANIRTDTNTELGIVSKGYKPFQNRDLAEFCESLAEQSDTVKVESAGSIRGGQKVWFLLKGESFSVRNTRDDEIKPYICVSNGHDGKTAMRITPTTVRVVCSNTLHMVVPQMETSSNKQSAFRSFHLGNLADKIENAKAALQLYGHGLEKTRESIDLLASRQVNREKIQDFFLECYTRDFAKIASNPQTEAEQKNRDKAMDAFNLFAKRFDEESSVVGTTAWNMFNAYTGWVQHDRGLNWKDPNLARDRRISSNLFGVNTERTTKTFQHALSA